MSGTAPAQGGPGKVLVGVDGSEDGLRATLYAMREAKATGSDLWLVHVVDDSPLVVAGLWDLVASPDALTDLGEAAVREARELLEQEGFPADRVTAEVRTGLPAAVMTELSAAARVAVMGRRSISGLERMFVGSTSLSLAASAECPVIVISAASTPQETGRLHTVAVAVHSWPPHSGALEWGVREAESRGARLRVVHVVPDSVAPAVGLVAAATADLEQFLAPLRARAPRVPIDIDTLVGNPIDELVAVSREVDLLVIGLQPGRVVSGLVRGVMAHAHCPVGLSH